MHSTNSTNINGGVKAPIIPKKYQMGYNKTIKKFNLTEKQVWKIVNEWYCHGMYPDLLHNENGLDLEEICERNIDILTETPKNKKK